MKKNIKAIFKVFIFCFLLASVQSTFAQADVTVRGVVRDSIGGIPSAGVKVFGTNTGGLTDGDGRYTIKAPLSGKLVFSNVGFKPMTITVAAYRPNADGIYVINVTLIANDESLEEVAIVGFGAQQRKASMVSAITSVNLKDLRTPSSNLTNALAGKVAGVIAFQQSGEPGLGTDNSTFYIRGLSTFGTGKRDPLILIDGIESTPTDMARLQPDDISDFSVLKDAAASSIYGARGANGVVLINTRLGKEGAARFSFRGENRVSSNTKNFQLADNITYMQLANEASVTRTPLGIPPYNQNKINHTMAGDDPYLYPNNNWVDQLIKDYTVNQGFNLNISGGTNKARYYIAGTYNLDNGVLNVDPINNFNSNIKLNNYAVRSNIDLNVTKSTVLLLRIYGQFDDYNGPIGGGATTFNNALRSNPVMFPAVYPQSKLPYIEHPLFGGGRTVNTGASETSTLFVNPYAEMVKGYQTYKTSNLNPQLEIKQDLNGITEGLSARAMSYIRRTSRIALNRFYNPFYYSSTIDPTDGSYAINVLNDGSATSVGTVGTEYLNYTEGDKLVDSRFWMEASVNYSKAFEKHSVGGMLVTYFSSYEAGNAGSLIRSLPNRNNGLSGRFSYGYDDRYLAEFNFGYNGSERFSEKNRFGFFPSGGIAYRISNEKFFEPLRNVISNLKFRATYGVVGNDQIGNVDERFLYMSNVNMEDAGFGSSFGRNDGIGTYYRNGVSISRYANDAITWEKSKQLNLGMDLSLFNAFDLIVDAFKQERTQILQPVTYIDNASGLMATPMSNYGSLKSQGVDLSANYRTNLSKNLSAEFRGTFTYATSKVLRTDELQYPGNIAYLSRMGYSASQQWGYIAERLFLDEADVANSPTQFGDNGLLAGDIKYRDINGDGVVTTDDQVALGYPTQPEIIYGFGSSIRFKKFDLNFYFQGSARSTFFIDPTPMQPFYLEGGYQTGLLKAIADDHWSEDNRNLYAFWPRLSTWRVAPNNNRSTWWMRNGSFIRLKNVDFGYNFTNLEKIHIKSARIYFSAINLFVLSKFKMWDVEMGGNGLNYPLQSVYNLGISLNL
ncbi:SusC/RagA family TonB-linked outer membrane protein [Pedobacter metabolipauper]|uniref:TonB-linked SusC/RagA family outer membrane protein n=1 Tax=Pedobacter metabolipauper TaxID=425513 RepID=A0A4R6SV33_9SPHI|nr:TonB-dependent receptor [Pedobacter metabolipauper]TDQ08906.1 TonB-linked SusC/RagA family outer membrane protein [Pedobacter metabolipauper]